MKITSILNSIILISFIFLLTGVLEVFAQPYTFTAYVSPSQTTNVLRYKTLEPPPTYSYTGGGYEIGRLNGSNNINAQSDEDIYRTAYSFYLAGSIPSDATIISAKLIVSIMNYADGHGNDNGKIVALAQDLNFGIPQEVFDAIGIGGLYFTDLKYSETYTTEKTSPVLTTAIAAALPTQSGTIKIGALSMNEGNNNSYADLVMSLEVIYTPKVSVTVQNSFASGSIMFDGVSKPHNSTVRVDMGTAHTLLSFAQTVSGVNYTPDNSWLNVSAQETSFQNPLTIYPTSDVTYRAGFSASAITTVKNSFNGGLVRIGNTTPRPEYPSGTALPFPVGSQQTLEAFNQDYQLAPEPNYYRVFQNLWKRDGGEWSTTNPLSINADIQRTYQAEFKKQFNIFITSATYIETGSGATYKVNGTDVGATWQSTRIEGDVTPITLEAVPPSGWVLLEWSDGLTSNPRSIVPIDHTNLSATYKMHLASSTSSATSGSNGGRKIADDGDGRMHAIYSSSGSIWYVKDNGSGGSSWTNEIKIGDGRNPSIAVTSLNFIHVVWVQDIGGGQRKVYYRRSTDQGASWEAAKELYTSQSSEYEPTPVVFGNSKPLVVWRYGQSGSGGLYSWSDPAAPQSSRQQIYGTDWQSQSPSGTELLYEPYNMYHLVYSNGNDVFYKKLYEYNWTISVYSSSTLSSGTGNINPSISSDWTGTYSTVVAAWENTVNHRIKYRESTDNGSSWSGAIQELSHGADYMSNPSVNYASDDGKAIIIFICGNHLGEAEKSFPSGTWSSVKNIGIGSGPSSPSFSASPMAVWTVGTAFPFRIKFPNIKSISGTVSGSWNGYYNIIGNITVNNGTTLTIAPGSVISFANNTSMTINGTLDAQGTSLEPILFTSSTGTTPGAWNYIYIQNGNSIIKYCTFEYGKSPLYLLNATAGNPTIIENSIIRNNSGEGLKIYHSNAKVKSCEIYGGSTRGIYCYNNPHTTFTGNWVHNNNSHGVYSISANLLDFYGNVIESNGTSSSYHGLYSMNSDVIHLGQPYTYSGYNTIRFNYGNEVQAGSGSPNISIADGSIHDGSGYEIYNTSGNPQIYTTNCYWDANGCQYSGSVYFNGSFNSLPTWDGQPRTEGSPLGKMSAESNSQDERDWRVDPDVPDIEKIKRLKEIIAKDPESAEAKEALTWLYSIIRTDYLDNALMEREKFFNYLSDIQKNYRSSAIGRLALRYMITWKMLESDDASVIQLSNDAVNYFTGEEKKWALADLAFTYAHSGKIEEARSTLQQLEEKFSSDAEIASIINNDISDVEWQIANGLFKAKEKDKSFTENLIPSKFSMSQNYPNPFNPSTAIRYQLPQNVFVTIKIFDILGKEVRTLVNEEKTAGYHSVILDGNNLSSGVYFYSITAGNFSQAKKMILAK